MKVIGDPVFLISLLLFFCSVAVVFWASPMLWKLRVVPAPQPPPPPDAPPAAPIEAPKPQVNEVDLLRGELGRVVKVIKNMEITQVNALKQLGGRLERIEGVGQRVEQLESGASMQSELAGRLGQLEAGLAQYAELAGKQTQPVQDTSELTAELSRRLENLESGLNKQSEINKKIVRMEVIIADQVAINERIEQLEIAASRISEMRKKLELLEADKNEKPPESPSSGPTPPPYV